MILVKHHNLGQEEPYFYFALEQYLLNEVLKDGDSFFFTWVIKGVVIGKNQVIENEVNLDYLKSQNIKLFRRPTGGGCVYADENNTMFSIITKKLPNFSFKDHLIHIVNSMKLLNVNLEFSGRNDILFEGKKVSGNAFLQNKHGMLLHGTLLYNCNLETMVRAITPSDEKLVSKGIDSVRSRVINLKPYLHGLSQEEVVTHLEKTLTNKVYELSEEEILMLKERAKLYASKEWIYRQHPAFTKSLKKRIPGGLFELRLTLKDGRMTNFEILGDYFELKPLKQFIELFIDKNYTQEVIDEIFENQSLEEYILDVNQAQFRELLLSGIIEN